MKHVFPLLVTIILLSCGQQYMQQYGNRHNDKRGSSMPKGPGCYAKCLIETKYAIDTIYDLVYTGDDFENPFIQLEKLEVVPYKSKWVKKKADPSCVSSNPDDCFVWCLVEEPAKYESYYKVLDTLQIKSFALQAFYVNQVERAGGFTEWKQVLCAPQQTESFFTDLQLVLLAHGYDLGVEGANGVFNKQTQSALVKYQKDNFFPVGNLDYESLAALGLRRYLKG